MSIVFYDLIQEKVWSQGKRDELIGIFESEDPGHYQKLYFTGFLLKALNLSTDSVIKLIIEQSAWMKKSPNMTYLQVLSVERSILQRDRISGVSVNGVFLTVFESNENNETISNTAKTVKKMDNTEIKTKTARDYDPVSCFLNRVHVTCYYKKCYSCNLKNFT